MKIPTLKIGRRLMLAFGAQILLWTTIAGYALDRMGALEKRITEIASVNQREFAMAAEMKDQVSERFRLTDQLMMRPNAVAMRSMPSVFDLADQRYLNSEANLKSSFDLSSSTAPEERRALELASQLHGQVARATNVMMQQVSAGDLTGARLAQQERIAPMLRQWRETLSALEKIQIDQNAKIADSTSRLVARAHWVTLVVAVFALVVSASVAWSITCSITRPIDRLLNEIHVQTQQSELNTSRRFS